MATLAATTLCLDGRGFGYACHGVSSDHARGAFEARCDLRKFDGGVSSATAALVASGYLGSARELSAGISTQIPSGREKQQQE